MVRRCTYDGDCGAPVARAFAVSTACGRETALPARDYIYHIFSNRPPSWETIDYLFEAGARTKAHQGRSDVLYARPRMRDIFAGELRLTREFFFFGTRSRSSYERACWIGDFRFVFLFSFFFFAFSCLCTKLKINTVLFLTQTTKNSNVLRVPLSRRISTVYAPKDPKLKQYDAPPLYMTSNYNSNSTVPHYRRKQYITYTVTIVPFFCPPREATLVSRDPYHTPGTPINCTDISTL